MPGAALDSVLSASERHKSLLFVQLFTQDLVLFSRQLCNHPMLSCPAVPGAMHSDDHDGAPHKSALC